MNVNDPTGALRAAHGAPLSAEQMDARIADDEQDIDFAAAVEIPNHWTEYVRKRDQGKLLHDEPEEFPLPEAFSKILRPLHERAAMVLAASIATPQVVAQRGAVPTDVLAPFHALVKATLENKLADEPEFVHPFEKKTAKLAKRTESAVEQAVLEKAVWAVDQRDGESEAEYFARCDDWLVAHDFKPGLVASLKS